MNKADLSLISRDSMKRDLFYISRDPFSFRAVNYTAPFHAKCSLDELDDWLVEQIQACGVKVVKKPNRVQCFHCTFDPNVKRCYWHGTPREDDPWYDAANVVAELPGSEHPEEIIYLLSHKDSQSWINGPGAIDNGSGTVANLEMIRALAKLPRKRTVRVLFSNEEHWPWHSADEAREAQANGDKVIAVLNVDCISGVSDEDLAAGVKKMVCTYTAPEAKELAAFIASMADKYGIELDCTLATKPSPNDDDGSFIKAGFLNTVMLEGTRPYEDSQYHLPGDIPERVNYDALYNSVLAIFAAVRELDESGWK
ncbi:MAG: M28 family metallopeptidase [Lentisphaeria bacterium]|nr:M28 family metallopeptidase [Lentisphaeria bacterium]